MQHFLFCEKDVSADRWSKGRPCHHAHPVLSGDAKQMWWLPSTLSTPSENKRANSSSGGRMRAWVGLARSHDEQPLPQTYSRCQLTDYGGKHQSRGNPVRFNFHFDMKAIREQTDDLLICVSNFNWNEKSSHLRHCFDEHSIHTEQMNRLLDMHRRNNHYLGSSWALYSCRTSKQSSWNHILSISSLRSDPE